MKAFPSTILNMFSSNYKCSMFFKDSHSFYHHFFEDEKIKCFCFIKIIYQNRIKKKRQTEWISFNFVCLMSSTNILCTVDYHACGNVYHLLKTICLYKKQYLENIFKSFFKLIKTILNCLRSHWAQYQHSRGHEALG